MKILKAFSRNTGPVMDLIKQVYVCVQFDAFCILIKNKDNKINIIFVKTWNIEISSLNLTFVRLFHDTGKWNANNVYSTPTHNIDIYDLDNDNVNKLKFCSVLYG